MKAISRQAILTMRINRIIAAPCALGLALCFAVGAPSLAKAQSAADLARLSDAMKRLEARVVALESENKQARRETAAARAEAQALRRKMEATGRAVASAPAPAPGSTALATNVSPNLYAMATKVPPLLPVPTWGGFYAGAAFGVGSMHANETVIRNESAVAVSPGPFTVSTITNEGDIASGRNVAAMSSLLIGYNVPIGSEFIAGVQVEGTLANTRVNLAGNGNSTVTVTSSATPILPASTSTSTNVFSFSNTLDNRWMVSALARAGALIDPNDLVYILGGYTYGRFENINGGFGMNGGTAGIGWERQIMSGWTLRAEYRYTRFQDTDFKFNTQSVLTTSAGIVQTSNGSSVTHYSGLDMHSLWLGVSHYFSMN